ncbi:glycosyltransferase family 2 protein [Selenomonas sp. AE3005]|uniref:glycosyltransferase family 2 protein n=1 Tax=Selenomonas sp. AE3005 TaxID=1485543 RepID=UPI00048A42E6|nr:glycosyltransferase family 2 protein [Selenomonas sp. AE3005]
MEMNNIRLSACYIVRNEEKNLPISLNSVKQAVDEIIVVDTGSTDNTKAVAQNYGAKLYDYHWQNDFSAPRNYAIEQAQGEWILFLDADETFPTPLDKDRILSYLDSMQDKEMILLTRHNIDNLDQQSIFYKDWSPRIFRNRHDLRYQGRVHEYVSKSNGDLQVGYAPMEFYLLHTGYAESISADKCQRNLQILKQAIDEGAWEPVYDYYLTDCYYGIQNYEAALQHAIAYLKSGTFIYGGNGRSYRMILECMRALGMPDAEMLPWAEKACQAYPDLPEFYAECGMVLCGMGKLSEARALLQESLQRYNEGTADFRHETYFSPEVAAKVAARLGEIAELYGNKKEAAGWFVQALDYCQTNDRIVAKARNFLQKNKIII